MEQVFNDLVKDSKNSVDNLVKWIQDARLVDATKEGEAKARSLFAGVDQRNVELVKFKEAVEKLATEQGKSLEDLSKQLATEGPKLLQMAAAGLASVKDQLLK